MKTQMFLAAAALAAVAAPAQAATVVYPGGQTVGLIERDGIFSGAFEANVITDAMSNPAFLAEFFFTTPTSGTAAASVISIALNAASNINFTSFSINGMPGTVTNGVVDLGVIENLFVPGGLNTLSIGGNLNPPSGQGNAGFGGNVTFAAAAAVPEPTTWALFILGFGAVGYGLRRRNASVNTAKAKLNFA